MKHILLICTAALAVLANVAPAAETVTYTYDTAGNLLRHTQSVIEDSDNDGMSDAWEDAFFGGLSRDGTGDLDNDGMSDLAEFLAGTLPDDPSSALLLSRTVVKDVASTTVQWSSVPGKRYRVQFRNSLSESGWNDLPGDVIAGAAVASKVDTFSAAEPERYYRVQVVP